MFTLTPLPEAGRWHVAVEGTSYAWTTFAKDRADLEAILDQQRAAWEQRLHPKKKKVGQAMREANARIYSIAKRRAA